MVATKEQERKALQKIREIVAGLGENSYVATALEGMFEDAEENIETDFAFSMKSRYENAMLLVERSNHKIKEYEKQIEDLNGIVQKKNEEIDSLKVAIDEVTSTRISEADGEKFVKFLTSLIKKYTVNMETTAGVLVSLAYDPTSNAFQSSVDEYKWMQYERSQLTGLKSAIAAATKQEI